MVIAPKMEHGMKAKFKCKDGFQIKGVEFVECSFGNWTGEIPKCEEGNGTAGKLSGGINRSAFFSLLPFSRVNTERKDPFGR